MRATLTFAALFLITTNFSQAQDDSGIYKLVYNVTPVTGTWLKTDRRPTQNDGDNDPDIAPRAKLVTTAELGVSPGDLLQLYSSGDFKPCDYSPNPICVDHTRGMIAAFVDSRNRLIGVGSGSAVNDVMTDPSCRYFSDGRQGVPTDVPYDFFIPDGESDAVSVIIPHNARSLIFGANDCYFADNSDPNSDYAINISVIPRRIVVSEDRFTIEGHNKYSENSRLTARVVFPPGHPKAGQTDTSFNRRLQFEENGTKYYDGQAGATLLPKRIRASKGSASVTIKSTSTVGVAETTPPRAANIVVHAPRYPRSIIKGKIAVAQWRDVDANQIVDWLDRAVSDILVCARRNRGELKEAADAVLRVRQATKQESLKECGQAEDSGGSQHEIAISAFCVRDVTTPRDPHRRNEGKVLTATVLHEIRHAWVWAQRNRDEEQIVDDDPDPDTPRNDDDKDYYLERVSRSSAAALTERYYGQRDSLSNFPKATVKLYEQDAEIFGQKYKRLCP